MGNTKDVSQKSQKVLVYVKLAMLEQGHSLLSQLPCQLYLQYRVTERSAGVMTRTSTVTTTNLLSPSMSLASGP